ncbi:MAG: hypothetical protein VCD00_05850 [Candidatus Hydrogenedentota bacterium]
MKKQLMWIAAGVIGIVAIVTVWSFVFARNGRTSASYQYDADIMRLNDMRVMGELIEEFHAKTGRYPLQGESELQYYVLIAAEEQLNPDVEGPPYPHDSMTSKDFAAFMSEGLGRTVQLPYDPQLGANVKPNFYIYMMDGETFYFAIHLHESYGIAKEVGAYYYKLEISNEPEEQVYWDFDELMASEDYQGAASQVMKKPGSFERLPHRKD